VASKEEKLKQRYEQFFSQFVIPLAVGGDLRIGLPVNREEAEYFILNNHSQETRQALSAVDDERSRICLQWTRTRLGLPILEEDSATLTLACALYNLLFFSHPTADRWGAGGSLQKLAEFTKELLDKVPDPTNLRMAMAYYALLKGFLDLYRTDIEVRWWVGKENFYGTLPPKRLLYWKSVRRVTENRQKTSWLSFELGDEQVSLWREVLRKSPLTNLTLPSHKWPMELDNTILSLEDGDVWRGLCYLYLQQGFEEPVADLCGAFWFSAGAMQAGRGIPTFSSANAQARGKKMALSRMAQLIYHICTLGLFLRGESLLNQLSASLGQGESPEQTGAPLVLLTFDAIYETERQRNILKVPKEIRGEGSSPLDKCIQEWRKVVAQTWLKDAQPQRVAHVMSVL
jgi:hypothetical protein